MSKKVRFGIIGCGLMGKEFASAAARWCHLNEEIPCPEIVAVCDKNPAAVDWFSKHFPSVTFTTENYRELLTRDDIDAIYCALPHNLHAQVYCDIINAGKHLLGEKPFGIDKEANETIVASVKAHPEVIVRCASEFPYYPACQQLIQWIQEDKFGKIIQVTSCFKHSSDMDPEKPINWKRVHGRSRNPYAASAVPHGLEAGQCLCKAFEAHHRKARRQRRESSLPDLGQRSADL